MRTAREDIVPSIGFSAAAAEVMSGGFLDEVPARSPISAPVICRRDRRAT